jgi:hypothetical protein
MELRTRCGLALVALIVFTNAARAAEPTGADAFELNEAPAGAAPIDVRSGGVLQESFQYHRQGYGHTGWNGPHPPQSNFGQAGGWYGYGFPVQTYRWGWFGAGRYYPRVVWHRGYYDDCCRWAHRRGY